MTLLNVNPTRMELRNLKDRLKVAVSGHKILKDKQDGLMRFYIQLVRENHQLRTKIENQFNQGMAGYGLARAQIDESTLTDIALTPTEPVTVDISTHNLMSVRIPKMIFNGNHAKKKVSYSMLETNAEFDASLTAANDLIDQLLQLAEIEKKVQLMTVEIERTRRRVNALDQRTIPDLKETIKHIEVKLDESERADTTRLMKVKEFDDEDME